jgi:hypothetical protein
MPERPRPQATWVGERLVIVDFRPEARLTAARRLRRRMALVVSGLAVGGGLSLAGLALHHLLGG